MNKIKNQKPLISLIIPTRERADTLLFAIKTALDQKSDSYEVIVSDNFSQDNTKEVVQGFNDHRLIYINPGKRLSMCDNFDFAYKQARGNYIISIGDDDAVMPGAIDKLIVTIKSNPNFLVYCWPRTEYTWPKNSQKASIICLPINSYPHEINLKKTAKFVIRMGGGKCTILPSVYHSAVAKSILDKIRNQTGRIFHSTYADIFTAFAIPAFSDKAFNIGYIVTVFGFSPKSNSAAVYDAKNSMINMERHLQEYGSYKIHPSLFPGISVFANLLADTILVAMDKFPYFYDGINFNYNAMWAHILKNSKHLNWGVTFEEIIQKRRQIRQYHSFSVLRFLEYCILYKFAAIYNSFSKKNMDLGPFSKTVPDNIDDFVKQLTDYQDNCKNK